MEEKLRYELLDNYFIYDNKLKEYVSSPASSMKQYMGALTDLFNQQDKRIKELEEQIKTKETINNLYKTTISLRDSDFKDLVYENNKLKQENKQLKQSQKQLAIIKLKQIIYFMENSSNNHYPLPYEIKNFIENQIKDLEGIKNE